MSGLVRRTPACGRPRPFQETASRAAMAAGVHLTPYFFDLLHLDGVDLVDSPGADRLAALQRLVPEEHLVPRVVTADLEGAVRVGRSDGSEPHLLLGGDTRGPVDVSPDGRWVATAHGSEIRLWPMPDVNNPPLHTLPLLALLAKLDELTNVRVVDAPSSVTGYRTEFGSFPGWKTAPTW